MWTKIAKLAFSTVTARWITAGIVTVIIGGGFWSWHSFKEDLRDEGKQECVDEVARNNNTILEDMYHKEVARRIELEERNAKLWQENRTAKARHEATKRKVAELLRDQETQAEQDETYREWASTDLPNGVADRLRRAGADSAAADSN